MEKFEKRLVEQWTCKKCNKQASVTFCCNSKGTRTVLECHRCRAREDVPFNKSHMIEQVMKVLKMEGKQ